MFIEILQMFIPPLIAQIYLPRDNVYAFYPVIMLAGLGVSVALLLPW